MPLPEYSGALGIKRAAHLLRRATFGATKKQIDDFSVMTPATAVTALFRQALPAPVLPIDPKTGQEWFLTGVTDANSDGGDLEGFFKKWLIGQMMAVGVDPGISLAYSARERVVHFLHTHFTTITSKVGNSRSLYFQNALFRFYALDRLNADPEINFKTLTVKVSVDNAMLRLLDGNLNVKGSVNENYGRELLELYSIGRGLEGTMPPSPAQGDYIVYTEDDVKAAARVLSGWDVDDDFANIDLDTNLPRGKVKGSPTNASAHDNDPKQFSARMNNTLIQGLANTEESALDEIQQLVDMIYAKPETVKNICWKIYRFFVYAPHTPEASLAIDGPIITEMANTFVASGFKLQDVIENLLRSRHFYEAAGGPLEVVDDNFGGIIKSPLDMVVQSLRFFNVPITDMATSPAEFYEQTGEILSNVENQAMNFYEPYDVAGYDCYHQFPIYHRYWITPNTLANRYSFIRTIITQAENGMFSIDVLDFVRTNIPNGTARDARQLVIAVVTYLLPIAERLTYDVPPADDTASLTALRLKYFLDVFLDQLGEAYWTNRWDSSAGDLRPQLELLFNVVMQSPEYQLA